MIDYQPSKSCPRCGHRLVVRQNGDTQEHFLGCQQYPDCRHSEPMPVDQQLRAAGAQTLPGLG